MKRFLLTVLIVSFLALLVFACTQRPGEPGKSAPDAAATSKTPDGDAAMWVNGKAIPKKMVDDMIASMPPMYQAQIKTPQGMKNLLENIATVELVFDKAQKEGYDKKPEVQDKVRDVTKQVVSSSYVEDAVKKATSDEAAQKDFYEKNKDQFSGKAQVQASHILFKTASDGSDDKAKSKACEDVLPKASKAGADFAALAKQYSDDPSKGNGGDLGYFEKDKMVPQFAEAAFAMKPGEVKGCVKTQFGYHIIKKTGEKAAETKGFDAVKDQVQKAMQQKSYEDILSKLKAGADIKYNDKAYNLTAPAAGMPGMPGGAAGGAGAGAPDIQFK